MKNFGKEFRTLDYVIQKSENILLFAHSRPDGDTVGSVLALKEYAQRLGKNIDVACFDPFPEFLKSFTPERFLFPDHLDFKKYKLIIACDSVERGFEKIVSNFSNDQVVALIDHHPNITLAKDINIIDPSFSSVCEIIYEFFVSNDIELSRQMATYLMLGIIGDTGIFQHSNTTPKIMEIASILMKKGAPITKIVQTTFSNKNICTLKLWGRAFERAKINSANGMILSVITHRDLEECQASTEDIAQVASILNTVPGTKFSLILSERGDGIVKGSFRSEEYKGVDVSKIAAQFGGGGHKLASGFEIKGKIMETEEGWKII
ncbi:MAG TPA: bifunctional oligoribonuclease/PAP phosphatase NrnA [Candidatus Moranbacteria bacterium]|nr:bifunctional oligoribonuclease/PAP phosphatase NrnA [Candidatus Moranbacteria bacterium]